jgi:hypothetical protein
MIIVVIAMTVIGWLALMVLFVAACHAAHIEDNRDKGRILEWTFVRK